MNLDRGEYGQIYHHTFGKAAGREACRQGWERWQKVLASGAQFLALHPHGTPAPEPHASDYWAFATLGSLRFLARITETFLPQLPEMWLKFTRDKQAAKLLATCGNNPRQRARGFIQNSLVDGYVVDPAAGSAMAGAIAWLLSSMEGMPIELSMYHLFGFDISYIPGPPGQARMFNFRAVLDTEPGRLGDVLDIARAGPLPEWRPAPH